MQNELIQALTQHAQEVRTAKNPIDVFEQGLLTQAEGTLRIARISFQQVAASLLEVLDAQRVNRQTLFEYAQVRMDLSGALARLERASGGTF
jgi:cobalt-zinc-cadmium efflux system outer membrane protein